MRHWIAAPMPARNDGYFGMTELTFYSIIQRVNRTKPASEKFGVSARRRLLGSSLQRPPDPFHIVLDLHDPLG